MEVWHHVMPHLCPFFATPDDNNASFVACARRVISKERERLRNLHKRMSQIPGLSFRRSDSD